jgi:hypothetical protein
MGLNRTVAAVFGVVYLLVGIYGFIATPEGDLLGLFPVNQIHHIVHMVIGVVLLYGATSTPNAIMTNRAMGVVLAVVGVLGLISSDGFGIMPIGGSDIWLHLGTAAVLLIAGFMPERESATV